MPYEVVGRHAGAGTAAKAVAVASRSAALARWARPHRFDLGLAHGSVDIAVVGALLRIPTVQMQDYEHAGLQRKVSWRIARRVLVARRDPARRPRARRCAAAKVFRYPGLKEDYYLSGFEPSPDVLGELGLPGLGINPERAADERVLAVVRPPPETSAYHADNPLYERVLDRIAADPAAVGVVVPRTEGQRAAALARAEPTLVVPERAIDAQSLIAYADLVVSAGGTMNREAVALGTPVYTIFTGEMGAVDERLIADGLLRPLGDPAAIELVKRSGAPGVRTPAILGSSSTRSSNARRRPPRFDPGSVRLRGGGGRRLAARPADREARLQDRRDRHPERAQPATSARRRSWAGWRSSPASSSPGVLWLQGGDQTASILAGATVIAAFGVLDDVFDLPAAVEARRPDGRGDHRRPGGGQGRRLHAAVPRPPRARLGEPLRRAARRRGRPRLHPDRDRDRRGRQRHQLHRRHGRARGRGLRDLRRRPWRSSRSRSTGPAPPFSRR